MQYHRAPHLVSIGLLLCLLLRCFDSDESKEPEPPIQQTFEVTSTADSEGEGTLRWALQQANRVQGSDAVQILIRVGDEIRLQSPLPGLTRGSVHLAGNGVTISGHGLSITSAQNQVNDLVLVNMQSHAVHITGASSSHNTLAGLTIGEEEESVAGDGIRIDEGAHDNTILNASIVGCAAAAIRMTGQGVISNRVSASIIGLRPSGAMVANGVGIVLENGASQNQIGDTSASPVEIGGSKAQGVLVSGESTTANLLQDLYIGLRPSGARIANLIGILVNEGAQNNIFRNCVAANNIEAGIKLMGSKTTLNEIQGGHVGLRPSGALVDPNQKMGIVLDEAVGNRIGAEGAELHVSGSETGILISGGSRNEIAHTSVYDNALYGIRLDNSSDNTITYNEIRQNADAGVFLSSWYLNNVISRNSIWGNGKGITSAEGEEPMPPGPEGPIVGGDCMTDADCEEGYACTEEGCSLQWGPTNDNRGTVSYNAGSQTVTVYWTAGVDVELYLDPDCSPGSYQGKIFLDAKTTDDQGAATFLVSDYPQATSLHLTYLVTISTGTLPFQPVTGGACE